ncbi:hypothetical protein CAEBREN_24375 [Caenorhabditis brenneri]|uniref:Uncharacterized protein n=1 Tax=Caenorhabditis brenneri TaxID=135651 RepID=G0MNI1_CAEBE|nr:hypothetical protein CAEBREN_24375 [Caenorhabditis brenneri]
MTNPCFFFDLSFLTIILSRSHSLGGSSSSPTSSTSSSDEFDDRQNKKKFWHERHVSNAEIERIINEFIANGNLSEF